MKLILLNSSRLQSIVFTLVLMALAQSVSGAATDWNGSNGSNWFDSSNWSNGVPTNSLDVNVGVVSSGNYPNIGSGTAVAKKIKVFGNGATLTINGGTLTSPGDLKIETAGEFIQTGGTVSIKGLNRIKGGGAYTQSAGLLKIGETASGDFKIDADGVFSSNGGTVEMYGTTKKIEQLGTCTFYNLSIAGNRNINQNSIINIRGDFTNTATLNGTSELNLFFIGNTASAEQVFTSGGVVNSTTNYTVSSGATLQMADASTVVEGASFTLSSGATLGIRSPSGITSSGTTGNIQTTTRTYNTGASYIYNGSANQAVGDGLPATVNNLTVANTGGSGDETVNLGTTANRTINGDLTITDGTFWIRNKTVDHSLPADGTLTIADGATLRINGGGAGFVDNFPANYSTVSLGCNSVVNYSGSDQIISPQSYGTALLQGSGTKRLSTGTTDVCIAFEVNSGITLQMEDANTIITGSGAFDLKSGATIGITSENGIASTGASGHIQTTTRTYSTGANYIYNGDVSQVVGSGLPATVASLTIDNTGDGSSFDNEVTLYKDLTATDITVSVGELFVTNSAVVEYSNSITNNANIEFEDDAALGNFGDIPGSGTITISRSFNRSGWQHVSFPVKSTTTKTLGDILKYGEAFNYATPKTPQTNIFYWDAATASWEIPDATTALNKPFNIFSFADGEGLELTVDNADFNNDAFSQPYIYFDNTTGGNITTPGNANPAFGTNGWATAVKDGWNLFANPFQAYLNSTDLNADLTSNGEIDNGVYVWDGYSDSYILNPTHINPHQAYFVHANAGGGTISITNAARDNTGAGAGYFKTKNEITLHVTSADGIDVKTTLVENREATNRYDASLDAHYLLAYSTDNATAFNSVSSDSMMCATNQVNRLTKEPIYFTFAHKQNNKRFTFSLESSNSLYVAILEDTYTSEFTDLLATDYTFSSTDAADAQRF